MQLALDLGRVALRAACAALLLGLGAPVAQAHWLTKLAREAGEAGTGASKLGARSLDQAAAHIKAVPPQGAALAAHLTPEGHWKFVNREGEVFTAGTPEEMGRAVPTLLRDGTGDGKLTIYLTEDTVFGERALLKVLPEDAALRVVAGSDSYPLVRGTRGALVAAVRPNLYLELGEQSLFREAVAQLERPLSRADVRMLALEPGGPPTLSSAPRLDPPDALVDAIDPARLPGALRSVRGQTVLITGIVKDDRLHFRPTSGPEQSLKVLEVIRAAAEADVNLVILNTLSPRQPGGRNWLWQRIAVDGLDDALKRATLADVLDALGALHGSFRVSIAREGSGRITMRAMRAGPRGEPPGGLLGDWLTNATSSITGNVVTQAVEVHARDLARQEELDRRIVPWLPADVQIAYLAALVAGLLGWSVAQGWWSRLWPPERREEYGNGVGFRAARAVRLAVFVLVFLPVVGVPAFLMGVLLGLWSFFSLPFRALRRLAAGPQPKSG